MKKNILFLVLYLLVGTLQAQVDIANIFTNNMVLQAHKPIKIWGDAPDGELVSVYFNVQHQKTISNKKGKWMMEFPPMNYGDTVTIEVVGIANKIKLTNILVGDVWLCSGQSNMAMTVNGGGGHVYNYMKEINNANYPEIRMFNVKPNLSATVGLDVEGKWEICSPETVSQFSAVAYFFARKVYQETGIPIGIINSSWGGTDIETWISMDAFKKLPENFITRYEDAEIYGVESVLKKNEDNRNAFNEVVSNDIGNREKWYKSSYNIDSWKFISQPQEWSGTELETFDGVVWFKYEFDLSNADAGQPGVLSMGKVDDIDITWINGIKIGETNGAGYDRFYKIPSGVLKKGKNNITVKVVDAIRGGGFTGTKNELFIKTKEGQYSLVGDWKYKTTTNTEKLHYMDVVPNLSYGLLYNAMIDPLRNVVIKGVVWYQGENNTSRAYDYRTLFPTLIKDWRTKWGYDFSFYWVQLAGYLAKAEQPPVADSWAELRESQTLTLSLDNTGEVITTDIGDANDIHPKNKQDVGLRMAYIALNKNYGKHNIICSGPIYKKMKRNDNEIIIEFDNVASGLMTNSKYGYVEGFAIVGDEHKFVWANAKILGKNKVIVYSDQIKNPVAVRYCWASNPDVNLYNSAGLPACPFRTDSWRISTEH